MRDQPEPSEREDELASTERQQDEDAMRYPGHEDPAEQRQPPDGPDDPIHEA
jgi:hypothetical protein